MSGFKIVVFGVVLVTLLGLSSVAAADDKPLRLRKKVVVPVDAIDEGPKETLKGFMMNELEEEAIIWRELNEISVSMSMSMSL